MFNPRGEDRYQDEYVKAERASIYPYHDLFLWCLLFGQNETAKIVWEKTNDGLVFALAGASICRKLSIMDCRNTDMNGKGRTWGTDVCSGSV